MIHYLWEFCACLYFVIHYFVSILVLQGSWLLCYHCLTEVCYYKSSVALPHGVVGWSAVSDCGIS